MKNHTVKTALVFCLAALLFAMPLSARAEAEKKEKPKRAPDPLMRLIPKDALFCVRINNVQGTLESVDKFIQGLIPLPIKLSAAMEDDNWKHVVKDGNFALFGVILEGEAQEDNPVANLFAGMLIPVTNYKKVVSDGPDIPEPDENGISRAGDGTLLTQVGKYALLTWDDAYDKLLKAKKLISVKTPGLRNAIGLPEYKIASGQPVWIYANVQVAKETFCPFITKQVEELKKQLQMMPAEKRGPMKDPSAIIDMYAALFGTIAEEIQYYSLGIEFGEDALKMVETLVAKEGTEMAEAFQAALKPKARGSKTLAYLEDGAMLNLAFRANSPFLSKAYVRSIDLLEFFGGVSGDDIAKLKGFMTDELASLGDRLALSFRSEKDSPFVFRYVVEIDDKAKFEKAMEGQIALMQGGFMTDLYKDFGMKLHMHIERGAEKYKGVSIDAAKLAFSTTERNEEMEKMIEAMYGEGFDYRWATVDNLAVIAVGGDVDAEIRKLIDHAKAGGPKRMGSEFRAAQKLLATRGMGDFMGTFNLVRMMNMIANFIGKMPHAPEIPAMTMESKSNLVFVGRFRNGKLTTQSVLPKAHIQEAAGAFMAMQMTMAQHRQQHVHRIEEGEGEALFNGKDLSGWEATGNAKWEVVDGMLVGTQGENNAPGDLFTKKSFKDFELTCTYKTEWPCNSGIWFRYQSPKKAYQADILEWKDPECFSGTIYCPGKMFISMNEDGSLVNREGWNTMKIRAKGDHLQVWLNGKKVGDVREGSFDSGKIGFQVHPGAQFGPMKIVVKEMKIKEL